MTVVISNRTLTTMEAGWWPSSSGSLRLYNDYSVDYGTLYKTQPNVRTCVDFLARNIAQLGLHVFQHDGNNDRVRLYDHPLAVLINRPMPEHYKVSRYRLIESLMGDLGVYYNAYWLKVRTDNVLGGLLRIPPFLVDVVGGLYPELYRLHLGGELKEVDPDDIVHFRGYNTENAIKGLSPLETLRRVLAEEHAAGNYRENFWKNAARMNGIVTRPKSAGSWSEEARQRFKKEFEALYSGERGSGKTAVLEEDMKWESVSFNPKDSEYLEGRKLTREECARAYHIPPPLVGILEHATYSNITQQTKNLYNDVLGPWLAMLEAEIKLQVMPEFENTKGVYIEFNIKEKLQGDFKEQTRSLQSAVGRPWMTANEARSLMNLSRLEGADELVTPLNVLIGNQASPNDADPSKQIGKSKDEIASQARNDNKKALETYDMRSPKRQEEYEEKWRRLLIKTFERQRDSVLPKIKQAQIEAIWDAQRWDDELIEDFYPLSMETTLAWAESMGVQLGVSVTEETFRNYLQRNAQIAATYLNQSTRDQLEDALRQEDPKSAVQKVFEALLAVTALRFAIGRVNSLSNYGAYKIADVAGMISKTWIVNSSNPRDSHAHMNGETVGIRQSFSNGLRWPGDHRGSAEETCYCQCTLRYNRETDD